MSLDNLRDLNRKYFPGIKHCRSKLFLRKKISFMIQAKAWGCLEPSLQKQFLDSCSVKTIMEKLQLSDRKNFLDNYLNPAINGGFVRLIYPDSPRHPRQKHLLTVKEIAVYQDLQNHKQYL